MTTIPTPETSSIDRRLLGVLLMTIAMCLIPARDGVAKHLSDAAPPLFLAWCSYAGGALFSAPLALPSMRTEMWSWRSLAPQLLRSALLVAALGLFFTAVSTIPLADALGAYLIAPIIATVLAVVLLGEKLTLIGVVSALMGLAGALLIVEPGAEIKIGALYAMGSGACFGAYLVATRAAAAQMSPLPMLLLQNLFGALLLAPALLLPITPLLPLFQAIWPWLIALGALSVLSHYLSISAFGFAPASLLAPLVYVEVLSGALIGYLAFNDLPTLNAWIGIGLICVSGLLLSRIKPQNA